MSDFLAWLSPILAAIAICAGQAAVKLGQDGLAKKMEEGERKRDEAREEAKEKREEEARWRDEVDAMLKKLEKSMSELEAKTDRSIGAQAAQLRSDIIHKCHRYLQDRGNADTDEKLALADEHEQYTQFCDDLNIENHIIDSLVERVMALPERSPNAPQTMIDNNLDE